VHEALTQHPAIKLELDTITQSFSELPALKFIIKSASAEQYRWEALCAEQERFLANMCTISRVTPAKTGPGLRPFTYPLTMVAFLSALGVPAEAEFEKIRSEIGVARAKLDIECTFFLGEQDLLRKFQRKAQVLAKEGIKIEPIPPTGFEITQILKQSSAQFFHFFCHGIEGSGVQGLSLATINDHDKYTNKYSRDAAGASIFLSVDALSDALALNGRVWVTVLNSCSGAEVPNDPKLVRQLHSMALQVAAKGCPYAIGMAEPIEDKDATTFSEYFYKELFAIVTNTLGPAGADARLRLNLAAAVLPARRIIHECHLERPPDGYGRWLLPLVYERSQQPLVVQSAQPELAKRVQETARALRILPPDTPFEFRARLLKMLDEDPVVPPSLRPNHFGEFV
jgi:hypothetical protein